MNKNKYIFFVVLLISLTTINIMAQNIDLSANGKLVAEGKNTKPVEGDDFKLTSYRLEIIPDSKGLPNSLYQKYPPYVAVRLVLIGEFKTGSYIVWLNGAPIYVAAGTGSELALAKVGSQVLFQEGLEIAVSRYGLKEPRVVLPEPFVIPAEFTAPAQDQKKFEENMTLRYRSCGYTKSETDEKCVIVSIYTPVEFNSGGANEELILQIGGEEFEGGPGGFVVPWKQFEQFKDGDWMVVKRGRGPFGGVSVGRLNKSLLKEDNTLLKVK
jgi:hypothetical protein